MPRERIYTQHHPAPGQDRADPTFWTEVAWSRDGGYIQVATIAADGTERVVGIVNEWLKEAGMPLVDLEALRSKLGDTPPAFDGWHATLEERGDINRLIRVLRTARDQAFGRDE